MNPSIALDPFHLLQKTCFSSWTAPWPACLLNAWTARDHVDMILLLPCPFLTTAAIMGLVWLGDWTEFWKSRIKRDTIPFFLPLISLPLPSHGIITWMYGQFCFWQVTNYRTSTLLVMLSSGEIYASHFLFLSLLRGLVSGIFFWNFGSLRGSKSTKSINPPSTRLLGPFLTWMRIINL